MYIRYVIWKQTDSPKRRRDVSKLIATYIRHWKSDISCGSRYGGGRAKGMCVPPMTTKIRLELYQIGYQINHYGNEMVIIRNDKCNSKVNPPNYQPS